MKANKVNTADPLRNLTIVPFEKADLAGAQQLFRRWSHKNFQLYRLRIPKHKMVGLLTKTLEDGSIGSLCAKDGGQLVGLLSVKQLPWISRILETRAATSVHFVAVQDAQPVYHLLLEAFFHAYPNIEFMDCRAAAGDIPAIQELEESHFRFVGNEVFLSRDLGNFKTPAAGEIEGIQKCQEQMWPQIVILAEKVHVHNRYMNDPCIPEDRAQRIFSHYISDFGGRDEYTTLVKVERGKVIGFIVYKWNTRLSRAIGRRYASLDFIGVDPETRSSGIGYLLNLAALTDLARKGADHVVVRTNGSNYPALRILYRSGFKVTSSDLHFHFWRCFN